MRCRWTDAQRRLREIYAEAGRGVAARTDARYDRGGFDQGSWQGLADAGFWRLAVPTTYGGAGTTWWEFAAALEGLATTSRDLGFLLSIVAHAGLLRAVLRFGTESQLRRYLPKLMTGRVGATAITEPTGGSDVARIRLQAVQRGPVYHLTGDKAHITNAPVADVVLVVGRIPDLAPRDITLFLVERDTPGLHAGPPEDMLGNRTSPTGHLQFNGATIPEDQVLGPPGAGLALIYNTIALDRALYGVIAAGYLEWLLDEALDHCQRHEAFRAKLATYQYVQGRLTDIKIGLETTRWVSYAALDQLLHDDPSASAACSLAKLVGSEALAAGAQHVMRIFGHAGYEAGPVARAVRDSLGTLIAGGTTEMQRKNLFAWLVQAREIERCEALRTAEITNGHPSGAYRPTIGD